MRCNQRGSHGIESPTNGAELDWPEDLSFKTTGPSFGTGTGCDAERTAKEIDVDRIEPDPRQPRTDFDADALARLASSLTTHGLIQPITVRRDKDPDRYLIVCGERRWRAAVLAGRSTISAVILDGDPGASRVLELQLLENALREDLSPLDQARAFQSLMDGNGWSLSRLAEILHLHRSTVGRALALLELSAPLRDQVEAGALAPSAALEIGRLDDPDQQRDLASRAVTQGLSRRQVKEATKKGRETPPAPAVGTTRVFHTTHGRVTVELNTPGNSEAIADAVIAVAKILQGEMRILTRAVGRSHAP
jgi:ParB family chromosome partitioning protein